MKEKALKEVVNFIVSFLFNKTGSDIFDSWKEKRNIKKILREDQKNIKRVFYISEETDLYNLVEGFIIYKAFMDTRFYSPMILTEEQENELWQNFKEYLMKQNGNNSFEISNNYKDKIVRCINLHNDAINRIIMDEKSKVQMKVMRNEYNDINKSLNKIIDTLNTDTPLQDENNKLGFLVSQIEAIMKSYRFDINQLRRLQLVCIGLPMLIMFIMAITIPLSLKNINGTNSLYLVLIFIVAFIGLSLIFGGIISNKLKKLEDRMEIVRKDLLKLHYGIYYNLMSNQYISDSFFLEEFSNIIMSLKNASQKEDGIRSLEVKSIIKKMEILYDKELSKIEIANNIGSIKESN